MSGPIQFNISVAAAKALPNQQANNNAQELQTRSVSPQQITQATQVAATRETSGPQKSASKRTIQVPARVESKSEPSALKKNPTLVPSQEDKEPEVRKEGLDLKV